MGNSLTSGTAMVACRIGHHGHWISILDFHVWAYMKNMVYEHMLDTEDEILQ
jgi:hypothetical protein